MRVWKPAIQQTWKSAVQLRGNAIVFCLRAVSGCVRALRATKGRIFALLSGLSSHDICRVTISTDDKCTGYHSPGHPERPARITDTVELLKHQTGLPITWVTPGTVADKPILRAHTPEVLTRLTVPQPFDADTPYFENIADYARASVAAGLEALDRARCGESVFSLMRPPGHHATREYSMGFCYLNNIAIAVLEAQATGIKRVAVFDFDVHHGNGTEDILLDQAGTAFFSIHQSPAYPGTGESNRRVCERGGRSEPVRRSDVAAHSKRHQRRIVPVAAPDCRHEAEGRNELAE